MEDIALKLPGVESRGVSRPVDQRFHQQLELGDRVRHVEAVRRAQGGGSHAGAIAAQLNGKFSGIQEAFIAMFPPPPVAGLGTIGGFKLQIEDRAGLGYEALNEATKAFIAKRRGAANWPGCSPAIRSTCRSFMPISTAPRRAARRARDQRV